MVSTAVTIPSRTSAPGGSPSAARPAQLLGPGQDILATTRRLFLLLALASGFVVLPQAFLAGSALISSLAVAASVAMALSLVHTYRTTRQGWFEDAVEVVALTVFAACATQPAAAFGLVFARLWFRSLYGSRRSAILRPVLYIASLALAIQLARLGPEHARSSAMIVLLWSFPIILLTGMIGRWLAATVHTSAQKARLDDLHLALGADMLLLSGIEEIRDVAWRAHEAICTALPGVRLVMIAERDDSLEGIGSVGPFLDPPGRVPMPSGGLTADGVQLVPPHDHSVAVLDAAAGAACAWTWIGIPDLRSRGFRAWFAMGAPGAVPAVALAALSTQMSYTSLALGNRKLHDELSALARKDHLTSLRNRSSFLTDLSASLGADVDGPTSVLFIDLDDFKRVNDHFGHRAGDAVLREVARRLRSAAGPSTVCARIGGDEFAVLLPRTEPAAAVATAHRIAQAFGGATHPDGSPMHVSACIGVATSDGDADAEELVHRADLAMYVAKSAGRGQISSYDSALPRRNAGQAAFEWRLGGAARAGELVVHYQPVLSLPDRRCTAVEALVRWQHPDRGLLPPDLFIHAAERTGAIRSIGAAVLRQAVQDTARWHQEFPEQPLAVHVNVSALQLEDDDLLTQVSEVLEEFSLDPEALVIEVTESLAISSPDAARRLHALADRGVVLAIDDFGTGYSALQTLRTLPIQIVKIDRSFVAGSSHNPEDRAVTEAIVQMARRLGLRTVAEGVEELEQQAFLESIGATGAQGYLYRKPGTADELSAWFAAHLAARGQVPHQAAVLTDAVRIAR